MGIQIRAKNPAYASICQRYWAHSEKYRFLETLSDIAKDAKIPTSRVATIAKEFSTYNLTSHACRCCAAVPVLTGRLDLTQQVNRGNICDTCNEQPQKRKEAISAPTKRPNYREMNDSVKQSESIEARPLGLKDAILLRAVLSGSKMTEGESISTASAIWKQHADTEQFIRLAQAHCCSKGLLRVADVIAADGRSFQYSIAKSRLSDGLEFVEGKIKSKRWSPQWEVDCVEIDLMLKADAVIREIQIMFEKEGVLFSEANTLRKTLLEILATKTVSVSQVCMVCYMLLKRRIGAHAGKGENKESPDINLKLSNEIQSWLRSDIQFLKNRNRGIKEWHRTGGFSHLPSIPAYFYGEIKGDLDGWWSDNKLVTA